MDRYNMQSEVNHLFRELWRGSKRGEGGEREREIKRERGGMREKKEREKERGRGKKVGGLPKRGNRKREWARGCKQEGNRLGLSLKETEHYNKDL